MDCRLASLTQPVVGSLKIPYSRDSIMLARLGKVVTANGMLTMTQTFDAPLNQEVTEKIPEGFRPAPSLGAVITATVPGMPGFYLWGNSYGTLYLTGKITTRQAVTFQGAWIAA